MEYQLRVNTRVVFVKDPTALPHGVLHHEAVDALSKNNRLVILLSHGNKYQFPPNWSLPSNCRLIEYELTLSNIEENVNKIKNILGEHGVNLYSRHLDNSDPMPMLLAGACLTMGPDTSVVFVNTPNQFVNTKQSFCESINYESVDWDLFN